MSENYSKIIPSELTLVELCNELKTSPSWVNKAIRDFNLSRDGRGKLRRYTKDEFMILRNAKIMLEIGCSLVYIKDLMAKEANLRKSLLEVVERLEREAAEGKIQLGGEWSSFRFILNPEIILKWNYFTDENKNMISFFDEVECGLFDYPRDLSKKIESFVLDVTRFKDELKFCYRPLSDE